MVNAARGSIKVMVVFSESWNYIDGNVDSSGKNIWLSSWENCRPVRFQSCYMVYKLKQTMAYILKLLTSIFSQSNSSKRPYSPRDAPLTLRSPNSSPPRATSSSTTSIAKLLPALSSQTNSKIDQLLGSISNNPALQSVLSASAAGSTRGTSLSGSQRSPNGSEQSFSKVRGWGRCWSWTYLGPLCVWFVDLHVISWPFIFTKSL